MRILITGASGLLGASLTLHAASQHQVIASGRSHVVRGKGIEWWPCQLTAETQAENLVLNARPDAIFHCAAWTDVDGCEKEPQKAWALHVVATQRLARSACEIGARFFAISTDSVFDGRAGNYHENSAPAPLNVYARTKWQGELATLENCVDAVIVRTSIYGWNAQEKLSLSEWILGRLERGEGFTGFADVRFCPLRADDLARALLDLLAIEARGILHLAGGQGCSKFDFACAIAREFGLNANLIHRGNLTDAALQAPRPLDTTLCCDRACELLGYDLPDVASGLQSWHQERQNGWPTRLKKTLLSPI